MSSITQCPTETISEIFAYIPRRNCAALLTLCKTTHPVCVTRVYKTIFVYLPMDMWKLSFLADDANLKYMHLVRTFIVIGAGGKDARMPLHLLCVVLQRMSNLRTLIIPSTSPFQHLPHALLRHGITPPPNCTSLQRKRAQFLPRLHHLTLPTPSIAIPMQEHRNISSLTITKQLCATQLDALLSIISTQPCLRHVGLCVGKFVTPINTVKALLPLGRNLQTVSISNGSGDLRVSEI